MTGTSPVMTVKASARVFPSLVQVLIQISPIPISLQNQADFPGAGIVFHVLLALDRVADVLEELAVDEAFEAVALGEAFHDAFAMFPRAAREVAGYASVKNAVRAVGH